VQASWLVLLAVAAAPLGRAPLRLQFESCPDMDQATVNRVVATELEAALADERQGDAVTTAHAECANGRVHLAIDDPVTGKNMTRTLDLEGEPRSLRSRLLGLAISEAVLASWIELQLKRETPSEQPGALAWTETRREAAGIAERRLQVAARLRSPAPREIVAGPTARWFSSGLHTVGLSASARRWLDHHPQAGMGLEGNGSYGEQSVTNVGSGSAISFSLAPCLFMRSAFGRVGVTAGAGWLAGLARLAGEPASRRRSGRTAWRAWTGPFVAVDLDVPLRRALFLRATVESGYVLLPARGGIDSVQLIALDGSWLGGLLSLGMKL
jgi:hypothetical protein